MRERVNSRASFDRRSSISRNRLSSAEFQLNLSQDIQQRVEMKKVVSDFIQVLADIPNLGIFQESSLQI